MQSEEYKVIAVDRIRDGLVILFGNGKAGLYSAELLYSMLERAVLLSNMQEGQPAFEASELPMYSRISISSYLRPRTQALRSEVSRELWDLSCTTASWRNLLQTQRNNFFGRLAPFLCQTGLSCISPGRRLATLTS